MSERVESPSSINMYRLCPRKYWYRYIKRLPGKSTIDTTRGNIVHGVLEKFFTFKLDGVSYENCKDVFKKRMQELLLDEWRKKEYQSELKSYNISDKNMKYYFETSLWMLFNWVDGFVRNKIFRLKGVIPFNKAFNLFKPLYNEREYTSQKWRLRGKIDAIHKINGEIIVTDYKSSSRHEIDDNYKLQASIYALLYLNTHHKNPDKVCFDFLKFSPRYIPVNKGLLNDGIKKLKLFHESTKTKNVDDYPKKTSPLCMWRTGRCDFYEICDPFNESGKKKKKKV